MVSFVSDLLVAAAILISLGPKQMNGLTPVSAALSNLVNY